MSEEPLQTASRMADIEPFHVMDILARARTMEAAGRSIIHMEIGEPDFDTPAPVIAAGIKALEAGQTHYTPASGLPALRRAISDFYQTRYDVIVDPEQILVTPGASGALQLVLGTLVNPGEKILMPDPGYPCNRHMVRMLEGRAVALPVEASNRFLLKPEQIDSVWDEQTRAVMVSTPSNPTGMVMSLQQLQDLNRTVRAHQGALIVDEIYHGLDYEQMLDTALAMPSDNLFVVNSFSKYFGMTGWRLGWVVAPQQFVADMDRLAQNIFLAAPTVSQHAALAAFLPETLEILERRRQTFKQRRDYLYNALIQLGFKITFKPEGAFYLYADVSQLTDDSFKFASDLLERAGVAITPGKDFGTYRANEFVRIAYTTDSSKLEQGVEKIREFLSAGSD